MEIHQLKTFLVVAREGSITRASECLYLSQPAVSAHIKAIEDTLGLTLFERTPRGMSLTPDGQRLLTRAEQTLAAHRELLEEAARIKGRLTGKLRLGATGSSSSEAVGRLLTRLSERFPELELAIEHGSTREILNGIRAGTLDAGFYNEAGEADPALSVIEVARFAIYLAAPPGLVDSRSALNWQSLAQLPWICPTSSTCCGQAAETLFQTHHIRPSKIVNVDREHVTRTLIAGGVGLGLLHTETAMAARANGEVQLVCEAQEVVRVLFAQRADRAQDPLLVAASSMLQLAPTVV
ncbi:MAG TPA: LysR family transcriptional regulator [Polyangiaceae bacterium]|nr:LysR family transcriptional regulator [Polyangiaceae bacterium]